MSSVCCEYLGERPLEGFVWTCMQGLGEDVLADVLRCSRPSYVVTLQTPNARRNLPGGHFWLAQGVDGGPLAMPIAAARAAIIQLPAVTIDVPAGSTKAGGPSFCRNEERASRVKLKSQLWGTWQGLCGHRPPGHVLVLLCCA